MNKKIIISAFVAAGFFTPTVAFACSEELYTSFDIAETGTPTAIAYEVRGDRFENEETLSVADLDGNVIPGILVDRDGDIEIFQPDEPLEIGRTVIASVGGQMQEVTIVDATASDVSASVSDARIVEFATGIVCCEDGSELDGCGSGHTCWQDEHRYYHHVTLDLTLTNAAMLVKTTSYFKGDSILEGSERLITESETLSLRATEEDRTEDFCVGVTATTLDGELVIDETICTPTDEFLEVEKTEPDYPQQVAQCVKPPLNEQDPNWVKYGHTSKAETDGCSSTGATGNGSIWMVLLGLFFVARRRKN